MASPDEGGGEFVNVLSRAGRSGDGDTSISKEFDLALLVGRPREIGIGADCNEGVGRGRYDAKVGNQKTAQVRRRRWRSKRTLCLLGLASELQKAQVQQDGRRPHRNKLAPVHSHRDKMWQVDV